MHMSETKRNFILTNLKSILFILLNKNQVQGLHQRMCINMIHLLILSYQ